MPPLGATAPWITPRSVSQRIPMTFPLDHFGVISTSWPRRSSSLTTSAGMSASMLRRPGNAPGGRTTMGSARCGLSAHPVLPGGPYRTGRSSEELQRPLLLTVPTGCPEGEIGIVGACHDRRRQRGPRAFPGLERIGSVRVEVEHLAPGPDGEPEALDNG